MVEVPVTVGGTVKLGVSVAISVTVNMDTAVVVGTLVAVNADVHETNSIVDDMMRKMKTHNLKDNLLFVFVVLFCCIA